MTARELAESGRPGWYWWRLSDKWNWTITRVQANQAGELIAGGLPLVCDKNPKLSKGGEFFGPILPPIDLTQIDR